MYKEVFGQSMGDEYRDRFAAAIDEIGRLRDSCSARVRIGVSPHSVYTSSDEILRMCSQSCAELDIPVAMHLAETLQETEYTVSGSGPIADMRCECFGQEPMVRGVRPVRVVENAGLLRRGVTFAHCVDLGEDEITAVAQSGTGIAHCPRSNAYLGCGIAPIVVLARAGAAVGLGTDSAASCIRLDFFEEMRFAMGMQRADARDAGVMLAKDALAMATVGGARALGLQDTVGTLAPGMRADMIAVDLSTILPGEDVHLAVVSSSPADIVMTMVDGEIVEPDAAARREELIEAMECSEIA